jgi:hypothetical protein
MNGVLPNIWSECIHGFQEFSDVPEIKFKEAGQSNPVLTLESRGAELIKDDFTEVKQ